MKYLLTLLVLLTITTSYSQDEAYNRFSVDAQFGLNNPLEPMTANYDASTLNLYHVGLGFRYCFNTKFGMRISGNYDNFRESPGTPDFASEYYRFSLEGVANLGNMMDFQTWTRRVGLLFHMGVGYSVLNGSLIDANHMMHGVVGLTPQVRLSERFSMSVDASMTANIYQNYTYDLRSLNNSINNRGIDGYLVNLSLGVQYNFGPHARHADWTTENSKYDEALNALKQRVDSLEQQTRDDDGDGVANGLDEEPGTPPGTVVDTKGRTAAPMDSDSDNIPDDVDDCPFEKGTPARKGCPEVMAGATGGPNSGAATIAVLESVEVKFVTDQSTLSPSSQQLVKGIATVMKDNPSWTINITGHADDRASDAYNMALSQRRADAVKAYLVEQGVSADRITTTALGESQPLNPSTTVEARAENRRVQFDIK